MLSDAYKSLGSEWKEISKLIPGRSAKQCSNRWKNHPDNEDNKVH